MVLTAQCACPLHHGYLTSRALLTCMMLTSAWTPCKSYLPYSAFSTFTYSCPRLITTNLLPQCPLMCCQPCKS